MGKGLEITTPPPIRQTIQKYTVSSITINN